MSDVVVGDPLNVAQVQRQHRLGTVQGLDLAFLINAQHHGFVGRIQIKTDDVSHLLDEEGIGGQFEVFLPMGLQAKSLPETLHGGFGKLGLLSDGTAGPMRAVFGF